MRQNLINDFQYTTPGAYQHFVIPVGQYFTGSFDRLAFTCDNDANPFFGNSYFKNVILYDGSCDPQAQTITFDPIPDKLTTDAPFAINATASSGLPVSFTIVSGPAILSGNTLTLNGTSGTVVVRASQAGDSNYDPAPNVDQSFVVNAAPVASFTATPETGDAPLTVDFDASGSDDPDGIILGYSWDFGDGNNGTGVNPTHIYVNPGVYTATLIVMDDNNNTNSTTRQITVNTSGGGTGGGDVLMVVGNTTLNAGDLEIKNRLEGLNFTVDIKLSTTAAASDASGKALVAISSTVNSGDVGTTFRNVTVPVITWENYLYDDMGMTGPSAGVDYGLVYNVTDLSISNASHPLAGGLSGTVTATNLNDYRWGIPSSNAIVAAVLPSNPGYALSFGYEAGAGMVGMNAPARRVGFFLENETASGLTTDGWALFDAAICWLVDGCGTNPVVGTGTGLFATYYNNLDFTSPALTRIDPVIDFNWLTGSPDPTMGADTYSIRWEGEVEAQYTETYTFKTVTDDGVRLWVDGQLIIDQWVVQPPTAVTGTIAMTAGQKVSITMDYYENTGGAVAQLMWSSPGTTEEIVPQTQLYPADPPANNEVLLVVGNATLNNGDAAMKSQLEGLGLTVTVIDDDFSATSDANGKDLVIISASVQTSKVNTKFRDVAVPVINNKPFLMDDMNMTGPASNIDYGNYSSQTQITIQNPSHPLAAGFTGNVTVGSGGTFAWGVGGSSSVNVGSAQAITSRSHIFAYDAGSAMFGMNAPARRVGFFLQSNTPQTLNSNGWALFDAAICWAMNCGAGARVSQPDEMMSTLKDFEYYPNPLEDKLNISFTLENSQAVSMKVLDVLGKEVFDQDQYLESGKQRLKLNLSHLTSGYYFLTVEGEDFFESHKLVKISQ